MATTTFLDINNTAPWAYVGVGNAAIVDSYVRLTIDDRTDRYARSITNTQSGMNFTLVYNSNIHVRLRFCNSSNLQAAFIDIPFGISEDDASISFTIDDQNTLRTNVEDLSNINFMYFYGVGTGIVNVKSLKGSDSSSPPPSGETGYTHDNPSVGASSTEILSTNDNRKYALFINDSSSIIYLSIGSAASLNSGIRLEAHGGSYEMSVAANNLDTRAVNAIAAVAGQRLLVTEGE